ncbi:MAG: TatD family hydrolase [Eubacteriaceae bacterium]|nr:TatD family hydrolase [Eubacteriaceae bacterium]
MSEIFLNDTHAHLNDEAFDGDRDEVIASLKGKLRWIINNGYDLPSSEMSVALAEEYDFIYAAVGMHPHDSRLYDEGFEKRLLELLAHPRTVAVGEIGLDYHYDLSERDIQKEVFIRQLGIAAQHHLPATIHTRDAAEDTYRILREHLSGERGAVLHSFSQSTEMLKLYLDMNVCFSVSGSITFKNADKLREAVRHIPLDRMFIETDCPYLTPVPFRGKRNCSDLVEHTARVAAELKGVEYEYFLERVCGNAERFFGIA